MPHSYGPVKDEHLPGARWLGEFMVTTGQCQSRIANVLGVNNGRVWEWRHARRRLPPQAQEYLECWREAGFPRFMFWLDEPDPHLSRPTVAGRLIQQIIATFDGVVVEDP